jgi:hypothetical protein
MKNIKRALVWVLVLTTALLAGCKQPPSPQECTTPPAIDSHVTVEFEGGKGHFRTPHFGGFVWTSDCKYVREVTMRFQWHDNKLSDKTIHGPDFFLIKVSVEPSGKPHPAVNPLETWQFEPALGHNKYPIEFYPRTAWSTPDNPKSDPPRYPLWGVKGTMDSQTRRPFLTSCQIVPVDSSKPESIVDGDFPATNADAKCVGGFSVRDGRANVSVRVEIPAIGVPHIDRIYRALSELITPLIQE